MSDDNDDSIVLEVVMVVSIRYRGEPRHFNPDDVVALAREGIESHYEVVETLWMGPIK